MLFMALFLAACGSGQLGASASGDDTGGDDGGGDTTVTEPPPLGGNNEIKPLKPSVVDQEVLSTASSIVNGTCTKNSGDGYLGTSYVLVSYVPIAGGTVSQEVPTACQDDNTWIVSLGVLPSNVYKVNARSLGVDEDDNDVASDTVSGILAVTPATIKMIVTASASTIKAGQSTTLQVRLEDQLETSLTGNLNVTFSSACLQKSQAKMQTLAGEEQVDFSSGNGSISANYVADGCEGDDEITVSGTFEGQKIDDEQTVTVTVESDLVKQITWVSSIPERIVTKGTNGQQISTVKFVLTGERNAIVPNQQVRFELKSSKETNDNDFTTDVTLLNDTAVSNALGEVTVAVQSGFKPDNVTIDVIYENPNNPDNVEFGSSQKLTIRSGLTTHANFTLEITHPSVVSYARGADTVDPLKVTAYAKDRFGDPVADGTVITFTVENDNALNPGANSIGFFVDEEGEGSSSDEDAICETDNGECSVYWVPDAASATEDGWVTILALAQGQEDFNDLNKNNFFDDGDEFIVSLHDKGEPFLDHRRYFVKNNVGEIEKPVYREKLITSDFIEGDYYFIDSNSNGYRDKGDGKFSGVNCFHSTQCAKEQALVDITAEAIFHMASDDRPLLCQNATQSGLLKALPEGTVTLSGIVFCDPRTGGPLPFGSRIEASAVDGSITNVRGPNVITESFTEANSVTFKAGKDATSGIVTLSVTIPKGYRDGTGDYTATYDWGVSIGVPNYLNPPTFDLPDVISKGDSVDLKGECDPISDRVTVVVKGFLQNTGIECVDQGTKPDGTRYGTWSGSTGNWYYYLEDAIRQEVDDINAYISKQEGKIKIAGSALSGGVSAYLSAHIINIANSPDASLLIDSSLQQDGSYLFTGSCTLENTTDINLTISPSGTLADTSDDLLYKVGCNVDTEQVANTGKWRLRLEDKKLSEDDELLHIESLEVNDGTYTLTNIQSVNERESRDFDETFYTNNQNQSLQFDINPKS